MSRGRNIIGHLSPSGTPELLLRLRHSLLRIPVTTVEDPATSPRRADSHDASTLHHSLRKDHVQSGQPEEERSHADRTCELHGDFRSSSRCTCNGGYVLCQWPPRCYTFLLRSIAFLCQRTLCI